MRLGEKTCQHQESCVGKILLLWKKSKYEISTTLATKWPQDPASEHSWCRKSIKAIDRRVSPTQRLITLASSQCKSITHASSSSNWKFFQWWDRSWLDRTENLSFKCKISVNVGLDWFGLEMTFHKNVFVKPSSQYSSKQYDAIWLASISQTFH